jgi:hypothetical protein|tara:strand:- start:58 stop:900 length:843 start_codon:yes stop_codon:yes gene_type:complete
VTTAGSGTKKRKSRQQKLSSSSSVAATSTFKAADRVTHSHIRKPAQTRIQYFTNVDGKKTPRKQRQFLGTYHHVDNRVNGHVVRLDYYKSTGTKTKCYIFNNFDLVETSAAALADVVTDINQCFRQRFNELRGKGISKRFSRNFGVGLAHGVATRNKHFEFLLYRFKDAGVSQIFKEAFDTMRKIWSECMVSRGDDYRTWAKVKGKEWINTVYKDAVTVLTTHHREMDKHFATLMNREMAKSFSTALEPMFNEAGALVEFHMGVPLASGAMPGRTDATTT